MNDRLLGYPEVTQQTTLSQSAIRRLIKAGKFPRPYKILPRRAVFREGDVAEAMQRLLASATRGAAPLGDGIEAR